jgi:putative ABC transport system permease protein
MLLILQGAVSLGLLWAFLALAVHLSFRVLEMPDLSVEGTLILGAGTAATMIASGLNPFLATFAAMIAGALGGLVTGLLQTKFKIPPILAGILTMIASYSIALRIMGGSPLVTFLREPTVFSFLQNMGMSNRNAVIVFGVGFLMLCGTLLYCFYGTEVGAALRATGNNRQMAKAQGVNTDVMVIIGLMVSNSFVGITGALVAQNSRSASIDMGAGTIVFGLAAVIIAEVLFPVRRFWVRMITLVAGSIVYRLVIALVLELGFPPSDMRLFTAIVVAIALVLPLIREKLSKSLGKWGKGGTRNAKN